MQKIKYLIIFALILALALVYTQLDNYKKLTNNLLTENNNNLTTNKQKSKQIRILNQKIRQMTQDHNITIKALNSLNQQQNQTIIKLTEQIITLEENLSIIKINNTIKQIDYTIEPREINYNNIKTIEEENDDENKDTLITPSLTFDEENKITGFGIQYGQTF